MSDDPYDYDPYEGYDLPEWEWDDETDRLACGSHGWASHECDHAGSEHCMFHCPFYDSAFAERPRAWALRQRISRLHFRIRSLWTAVRYSPRTVCSCCGKPSRVFGWKVGDHRDCDEIPF